MNKDLEVTRAIDVMLICFYSLGYLTLTGEHLRRRHTIERGSDLLLPWQTNLAVDLRCRLEVFDTLVEQTGTQHDAVWAESVLCVVYVRSTVLKFVSIDWQ